MGFFSIRRIFKFFVEFKIYKEKLEREGVILGLSGGIDLAVIATLCVRALGQKKKLSLLQLVIRLCDQQLIRF